MSSIFWTARHGARGAADLLPRPRHVLRVGRAPARSAPDRQAGRRRRAPGSARRRHRGKLRGARASACARACRSRARASSRRTPCSCRRATACTATTRRACARSRRATRPFRRSRASTRCSSTSPVARACTELPGDARCRRRRSSASCSKLTDEIQDRVGLPASAGIATSRSVAKVASGLAKPHGVLLVPAGAEAALLGPLPVRKFPGIGPVAEQKLHALGLTTLAERRGGADRRCCGASSAPGPNRSSAAAGARARTSSAANARRFRSTIRRAARSAPSPTSAPFAKTSAIRPASTSMLCSLCERVCWRARKRGIKARTVTLKLRYADFQTLSRSRTITPTCSELELYPVVRRPVRARAPPAAGRSGCSASRFRISAATTSSCSLFDDAERSIDAVDGIRKRYGYDALRIALTVARGLKQ